MTVSASWERKWYYDTTLRKALIQDHEHYMLYRLPYFTQWMVAGRYQVDDDQLNRIA